MRQKRLAAYDKGQSAMLESATKYVERCKRDLSCKAPEHAGLSFVGDIIAGMRSLGPKANPILGEAPRTMRRGHTVLTRRVDGANYYIKCEHIESVCTAIAGDDKGATCISWYNPGGEEKFLLVAESPEEALHRLGWTE
jgi:hypothetical protein